MALSVAKHIIKRGITDTISIQKLAYISYGYHYHYTGEELFDDEVQAWKFGPAIPDLYRYSGDFSTVPALSKLKADTVDKVLSIYAKERPFDLVDLTHKPNTPWSKYFDGSFNNEIPKKDIKLYYSNLLKVVDVCKKPYVINAFKELAKR